MIVTNHVSWSGVTAVDTNDPNWFFCTIINTCSRFGVDLFVLIGAYFLSSKTLGVSDIAKKVVEVTVSDRHPDGGRISDITARVATDSVERPDIVAARTPVSIRRSGLGTCGSYFPYLILIAISPILNHAMDSMARGTHRRVVLGLTGLFILVPTINAIAAMPLLYIAGGPILSFITLYFVAAYIRKYDVRIAPLKGALITTAIIGAVFVLTFAFTVIMNIPTPENPNGTNTYFMGDSILPVFIGSIFLFLTFRSIDLKNKLISFSGKLTYEAFLSILSYGS
jgi:surface polysaccharide O-acyltransferase-like enzyme